MSILLFASCATNTNKFQRIGAPTDFISASKTVIAVYGTPAIYVNINVAGRNVGSWFGAIATAIGKSHDRNLNQAALNNLLASGVQQYTQDEIVSMISNMLRNSEGLAIGDSIKLSSDSQKNKDQKTNIPNSTEIFGVDSYLTFYAADAKNSVAASVFGAVAGIATKLEIHLIILSPAPERRPIWNDIFICELEPIQESLVENNSLKAKELLKTALDKLVPWIAKELHGEAYDNFPRVKVKYRSGLLEEGYLLSDANNFVVIRLIDGITRVLPKDFIREINTVKK